MNEQKQNRSNLLKMGLSTVLLVACVLLIVGAAWGRYRSEVKQDIDYYPRTPSQIYLWGEQREDGSFGELPTTWSLTNGGSEIAFTVTNGIAGGEGQEDLVAQEDLSVYIRVAATEGILDGENVSILLRLNDEAGTFYTAVPVEIDENSPLYTAFGAGWLYCFRDTEGKEPQWLLEGEKLSAFSATLVCDAQPDVIDYSMLQLQVVASGS